MRSPPHEKGTARTHKILARSKTVQVSSAKGAQAWIWMAAQTFLSDVGQLREPALGFPQVADAQKRRPLNLRNHAQ